MITLYDYVLSANCYKVRLMLALLGIEYKAQPVDFFPGREHQGDEFRAINPMGHIPVLNDDGFVLRDSHAIVTYLASAYDSERRWYPVDNAKAVGEVQQWLSFAEALMTSAGAARLVVNLGYQLDLAAAQATAHELLRVLDEHLWFQERQGGQWLCSGSHATIADIVVFPDVVLCEEGGVSRLDYPAIRRWLDRVKQLEAFDVMPGVFPFALS